MSIIAQIAHNRRYRNAQNGIIRRYMAEPKGWSAHAERCKQFIVSALHDIKPQSVAIMGSGWLLDVPIDTLLLQCQRVVLMDIVHPKQIVHQHGKNPKISFVGTDLTGLAPYLDATPRKQLNYNNICKQVEANSIDTQPYDMVVSLNLLSQLPEGIIERLRKHLSLSDSQIIDLSQRIQQAHIAQLPKDKSLLISDIEEEFYDEQHRLVGSTPSVFVNLPQSPHTQRWDWVFDTHYAYREDCHTTLKVQAIRM